MRIYSADWLLPITSPKIKNGAVVISDDDKIFDFGEAGAIQKKYSDKNIRSLHFKNCVIMPGVVNAHTHLELSMMKGVIPAGLDFADWVFEAMTKRFQFSDVTIATDCEQQVRALESCGTAAVGDIANHAATALPHLEKSKLYAVIFHEATGLAASVAQERFEEFRNKFPDFGAGRGSSSNDGRIIHALAPHAPYSVSPELFKIIAAYNGQNKISTVHLAESKDETEFLQTGAGKMKDMIGRIGRWDDAWRAPLISPVKYMESLGFLNKHILIVHAVHVTDEDIEILKRRNVSVCTCPRSNVKIHVGGTAPVEKFLAAGLNICIGTDSLASNDELNVWNEMHFLKEVHPALSDEQIIAMATVNGARALGFESTIGSIEKGKANRLIRVENSGPIPKPESFLLSGYTQFSKIEWL